MDIKPVGRVSTCSQLATTDLIRPITVMGVILLGSLSVVACGGGGGSSTSPPPMVQDNVDPNQDNEGIDDQSDENDADDVNADDSDNETDSEPTENTDDNGMGSPDDDDVNEPLGQRSEPFVVFAENEPAPGGNGQVLSRFSDSSLTVNPDGAFALTASSSIVTQGTMLWGGSIFNPDVLLQAGDALPGFPANVQLQGITIPTLNATGDIAAIASLSGASEIQAVVRLSGSEVTVVARSDEPAMLGSNLLNLVDMRDIEHVGARVGFISGARSAPRLWVHDGQNLNGVVTNNLADAELQPDGCRILFAGSPSSTSQFRLSPDGSVIFEGTITIEDGADGSPVICPHRNKVIRNSNNTGERLVGKNFSSIVRYDSAGESQRVVNQGDDVPGMSETFFRSVGLRDVLPDNTMVVQATLGNLNMRDNESISSLWLFKPDGSSRLIVMEGEQFDSSAGAENFVLEDIRGSVQVSPDGSVATVFTDNLFSNDATTWLLAGQAHLGQPHATIASIGAGSLGPVAFERGPSPEGFAASTFFGEIANPVALDNGGGYFTAATLDIADSVEPVNTIWKYDSNGVITSVLTDRQGVVIDGLPNLFTDLPNQNTRTRIFPVGDDAIVFIVASNGVRSKIVYLPIER